MPTVNTTGEKVSVCLLTYNHVNAIESTIRSIAEQSLTGYEIVVSDDCSNDGTWEKVLALAQEAGNIRAIRTTTNLGMAGNANFAVAQTTRPYIALLHHDDLYRQDLLEKWSKVLDHHPDVNFVFNEYCTVGGGVDAFAAPIVGATERMDGRRFLECHLLPKWACPVRGTAMIRRSAWMLAGGMRERFGMLSDVDLWMRLARTGAIGYVAEPLINVRHCRPSYYPDIYTGKNWSWPRLVLLYEIHAANRLEYLDMKTISGQARWLLFRLRVSMETLKWLGYAVVKRRTKAYIAISSEESQTRYDLPGLDIVRRFLRVALASTQRSRR